MIKYLKNKIIILFIILSLFPTTLFAYSDKIIAGGESVGIEINTNGVLIVGFYKVDGTFIGTDAGLKKGDVIVRTNEKNINNVDDFVNEIKESNNGTLRVYYKRDKKTYNTNLKLVKQDGIVKTGLYVKDSITGIGTLTFIDPNSKLYGALGHEIIDSSSGTKIDVKDGKIYSSSVTGIEKSKRGEPGSKKAITNSSDMYGNVKENTTSGIFGYYNKDTDANKLYKVANYEDIKLGPATILTVTDNNIKEEYTINILDVNNNENSNKNILFEVTDKNLLDRAGGIVQGMSGSPIIQNNNIIGAVTNVVINNPKKGYGILITSMLKEAEN